MGVLIYLNFENTCSIHGSYSFFRTAVSGCKIDPMLKTGYITQ